MKTRAKSTESESSVKLIAEIAKLLAPQIIGLYSKNMSFRDISDHIQQIYDVEVSHATLSEITERVIPRVKDRNADAVAKPATRKLLHHCIAGRHALQGKGWWTCHNASCLQCARRKSRWL